MLFITSIILIISGIAAVIVYFTKLENIHYGYKNNPAPPVRNIILAVSVLLIGVAGLFFSLLLPRLAESTETTVSLDNIPSVRQYVTVTPNPKNDNYVLLSYFILEDNGNSKLEVISEGQFRDYEIILKNTEKQTIHTVTEHHSNGWLVPWSHETQKHTITINKNDIKLDDLRIFEQETN